MSAATKIPSLRFKGFDGEWEEKRLETIAVFNPCCSLPDDFEYVDLESVIGTEMLSHRTEYRGSAPSRAQRLAQVGDLFYQTVRPYQRNNYLFELETSRPYVFSTGYAQLRPKCDGYFLMSVMQTDDFVATVLQNCTGTSYPAISDTNLSLLDIYFPSISEQQKIASAFRSLDALIADRKSAVERLQTLKKAMLEKMFPRAGAKVPEVRFKGFVGEWEERRLGEMGSPYNGLSGKCKSDFGHGDGRYVTYLNVFKNSVVDVEGCDKIEVDKTQNEVCDGDVFFTTSSETPEEVGMASVWNGSGNNTYLNSFCFGYRPKSKINTDFWAYMLRADHFRKRIVVLAQGISRYNISKGKVMDLPVFLPKGAEQKKIGAYFRSLDALISARQEEVGKLKDLKKALLDRMFV